MATEQRGPLMAFVALAFVGALILANGLRVDSVRNFFAVPAQSVVAGAHLLPTPADVVRSGVAAIELRSAADRGQGGATTVAASTGTGTDSTTATPASSSSNAPAASTSKSRNSSKAGAASNGPRPAAPVVVVVPTPVTPPAVAAPIVPDVTTPGVTTPDVTTPDKGAGRGNGHGHHGHRDHGYGDRGTSSNGHRGSHDFKSDTSRSDRPGKGERSSRSRGNRHGLVAYPGLVAYTSQHVSQGGSKDSTRRSEKERTSHSRARGSERGRHGSTRSGRGRH